MKIGRRTIVGAIMAMWTAPALAVLRKKRRARAKLPIKPMPAVQTPDPLIGIIDQIAEKLLGHLRETAVYNGTAGALNGGLLARALDDYSPDGEAALRGELQAARDLLTRIRLAGNVASSLRLATVSAILENGTRSAAIPYGRVNPLSFSGHTPYIVTQLAGPHIDSVNVMMEQQSLASGAAVDAWIEKLDSFPRAFDGVIEKIRADKAAGCIPPRALFEKALPVLDSFGEDKAENHPLMRALGRRMAEAGLSKRMQTIALQRATVSLQKRVRPAYTKLRETIAALVPEGRSEAGVWAQPMGAEFYAANVLALGDSPLSPDDIHQIGLDEATRISSQMNGLLSKRGLTQGSIGARMAALAKDPSNQFADSDKGRAELLDYVRAKVRGSEALYPQLLPKALIPRQSLVVKRVPLATQDSAPGGYYDGPSLDGTRPGTYWINLRDMGAVPRFRLPTLSYHEGVPGHHTQGAIAAALGEAPLLIRIASFNAFQEGWALYGEKLMAELGAYKDDPLGDLGRLQDELFRATRLVVDTGLHHKRWSREKAIQTMLDFTGVAQSRVTAEIERYMAWPGQALGYKLGQLRLLAMRDTYKTKAGRDTDLRAFHGIVLGGGAMPLDLIEQRLG
ncbi:MAG: DUF885 domain-containing protein [Pseudomonadota bacterium]